MKTQYKTIDEYIKTFPDDVQLILEKIRQTIRKAAPEATEAISYQMPAFKRTVFWFGLLHSKITSVFSLQQRESKLSTKNYHHTSLGREQYSFL
jgi:Domain of unknown function (DU1801)